MLLLQTLFTHQGFESRVRFFLIGAFTHLVILFSSLSTLNWLLMLLIILLLATLDFCSVAKRCNDAQNASLLRFIPTTALLICSLVSRFELPILTGILLLVSAITHGILLTYPSKNNHQFIFGYAGSIDLSSMLTKSTMQSTRIEPVFNASIQNAESGNIVQATNYPHEVKEDLTASHTDYGVQLRLFATQHYKIMLIFTALALVLGVLLAMLWPDQTEPSQTVADASVKAEITYANRVTLPDGFDLLLSQYQGIAIEWQAEQQQESQIWSQLTAEGEQSCQQIKFNQKDHFRPLKVAIIENQTYRAEFSPLDTKALVQAIAFRGSFTLCGYKFSLKGSQAALGKAQPYAEMVEY